MHFKEHWPPWLAFVILVWQAVEIKGLWPHPVAEQAEAQKNSRLLESAMNRYSRQRESRRDWPGDSLARFEPSPFNRNIRPRPARVAKRPPPPRNYKLRGVAGTGSAIMVDNAGRRTVVSLGETLDSAEVIGIFPDRVKLKDRSGTFEVPMESE